jgi:hypothetical protein
MLIPLPYGRLRFEEGYCISIHRFVRALEEMSL